MSTSNNRVDSGQGIMETRQLILPVHLSGNRSSKQSLASRLISGNRANYILITTLSWNDTVPCSRSRYQFVIIHDDDYYYSSLNRIHISRNTSIISVLRDTIVVSKIFSYRSTSFMNSDGTRGSLIVNFHEMDAFHVVFDDIETLL